MNPITHTYRGSPSATLATANRELPTLAAQGYVPAYDSYAPSSWGFLGRSMLWLCALTFCFCFLFVGPFAIIPASFGLPFAFALRWLAGTPGELTVVYQFAGHAAPMQQVTNNWFVMPPAAQSDLSMVDGAAYDVIGEARLLT